MQSKIIAGAGWPVSTEAPAIKASKRKTPKPARSPIDIASLAIANDPMPERRSPAASGKYDGLFDAMEIGQSVICKTDDVGRVAASMREWIRRDKRGGVTASAVERYETDVYRYDGTGRVWLVKKVLK